MENELPATPPEKPEPQSPSLLGMSIDVSLLQERVRQLRIDVDRLTQRADTDGGADELLRDAFALSTAGTVTTLALGFLHHTREEWRKRNALTAMRRRLQLLPAAAKGR